MIYEYALEPALVVDWALAGLGRCVGQFGLDHRRLVSDFPKDWKGQVYGEFLARFDYDDGHPDVVSSQPILDAYLQLLTDCMVPRRIDLPYSVAWLDEAIKEHTARPFHAIFASKQSAPPHPDIITEKSVDDIREKHWWLPTVKTTRKSAAEIGAALRPILQVASEIHIIDPYFDPGKKRFQDTFAEIVRQSATLPRAVSPHPLITLVTGVDREFKEHERPSSEHEERERLRQERNVAADILRKARSDLPALIPAGVTVRLVILKKAVREDPLHNRFVLTDVGGVILPYGVDDYDREEDHSAVDDIIPMSRGIYDERWAQYVESVKGRAVIDPETIAGD